MFEMLECDKERHTKLLGTQGVTEANMMAYMGIIEQRINEILQVQTYLDIDSPKLQ
jgi:hypothetical protein